MRKPDKGKGKEEEVVTFEHFNVNGITAQDNYVELDHVIRTMNNMGAGMYSINEHKLDTTQQGVRSVISDTIEKIDKHTKFMTASNEDMTVEKTWKPGGVMLGMAGKWASRWRGQG